MKKLTLLLVLISSFSFAQKNDATELNYHVKKETFKSIKPITNILKDKTIVGLGEGTHGTKEFNLIRNEIIKDLIKNHQFRVIAFEGAFGDSYFLNKGINSNQEIRKVMKDYLLSIWQTKEFENLFQWIRDYNKKNTDKIIISGFDTNYLNNSVLVLDQQTVKSNTDFSQLTKELSKKASTIDNAWTQQNSANYTIDMNNLIKIGSEGYFITKKIDSIYQKELNYDSKIALNNLKLGFENFHRASKQDYGFDRDSAMADNIHSIQTIYNKKTILIAHNAHIANKPTLINGMGQFLKKKYDDTYYALATFTSKGTYSAMTDNIDTKNNKFTTYNFPPILENSWELELNKSNFENYFVSFKENKSKYYNNPLRMRFIGYTPVTIKNDKYTITQPIKLNEIFDGFIYLKNTNASEHF